MTSGPELHGMLPSVVQAFLRQLPELSPDAWVQVRAARSGRVDRTRKRSSLVQARGGGSAAFVLAGQWLDRGVANGILPNDGEARAAMDGAIATLLEDADARTALQVSGYGPFHGLLPRSSLHAYNVSLEELAAVYGPPRVVVPTALAGVAAPTLKGTIRGVVLGLGVFGAATALDFPVGQIVGALIVAGFGYRWFMRGHVLAVLRWFGG